MKTMSCYIFTAKPYAPNRTHPSSSRGFTIFTTFPNPRLPHRLNHEEEGSHPENGFLLHGYGRNSIGGALNE